jgi:hypothetical protein
LFGTSEVRFLVRSLAIMIHFLTYLGSFRPVLQDSQTQHEHILPTAPSAPFRLLLIYLFVFI